MKTWPEANKDDLPDPYPLHIETVSLSDVILIHG
ncbi:hypothetical protein LSH36_147g09002 [Paralvinella palmiformis]|uniref:Uncharacterized protein n=1 Tax=Paralvinella palmiformis TaxID=53620 RepID=A0AAD9N798_9ANNE|nr:hypothetical protein LSH36_147g09002 [Paralvinella palmiformis]